MGMLGRNIGIHEPYLAPLWASAQCQIGGNGICFRHATFTTYYSNDVFNFWANSPYSFDWYCVFGGKIISQLPLITRDLPHSHNPANQIFIGQAGV